MCKLAFGYLSQDFGVASALLGEVEARNTLVEVLGTDNQHRNSMKESKTRLCFP